MESCMWNQIAALAILSTTKKEELLQCSIAPRCWNPALFPYLTLYGSTACAGTEEFHAVMGGLVDHFHTCVTNTLRCCCFSGVNYLHFPVAAPLHPHSSLPCEPMGGSGWSMEPLSSKFGKNVWQVPFWGLAIVQVSKEFCSKVVNNEVIKINSSYAG